MTSGREHWASSQDLARSISSVRHYISMSISRVPNLCHLLSEPTPSFGAVFALGRVINARDALNLGCPVLHRAGLKILSIFRLLAPRACAVYLSAFFPSFWWSPLNKYLQPERRAMLPCLNSKTFCVFAYLCIAGRFSQPRVLQHFLFSFYWNMQNF